MALILLVIMYICIIQQRWEFKGSNSLSVWSVPEDGAEDNCLSLWHLCYGIPQNVSTNTPTFYYLHEITEWDHLGIWTEVSLTIFIPIFPQSQKN